MSDLRLIACIFAVLMPVFFVWIAACSRYFDYKSWGYSFALSGRICACAAVMCLMVVLCIR